MQEKGVVKLRVVRGGSGRVSLVASLGLYRVCGGEAVWRRKKRECLLCTRVLQAVDRFTGGALERMGKYFKYKVGA